MGEKVGSWWLARQATSSQTDRLRREVRERGGDGGSSAVFNERGTGVVSVCPHPGRSVDNNRCMLYVHTTDVERESTHHFRFHHRPQGRALVRREARQLWLSKVTAPSTGTCRAKTPMRLRLCLRARVCLCARMVGVKPQTSRDVQRRDTFLHLVQKRSIKLNFNPRFASTV